MANTRLPGRGSLAAAYGVGRGRYLQARDEFLQRERMQERQIQAQQAMAGFQAETQRERDNRLFKQSLEAENRKANEDFARQLAKKEYDAAIEAEKQGYKVNLEQTRKDARLEIEKFQAEQKEKMKQKEIENAALQGRLGELAKSAAIAKKSQIDLLKRRYSWNPEQQNARSNMEQELFKYQDPVFLSKNGLTEAEGASVAARLQRELDMMQPSEPPKYQPIIVNSYDENGKEIAKQMLPGDSLKYRGPDGKYTGKECQIIVDRSTGLPKKEILDTGYNEYEYDLENRKLEKKIEDAKQKKSEKAENDYNKEIYALAKKKFDEAKSYGSPIEPKEAYRLAKEEVDSMRSASGMGTSSKPDNTISTNTIDFEGKTYSESDIQALIDKANQGDVEATGILTRMKATKGK